MKKLAALAAFGVLMATPMLAQDAKQGVEVSVQVLTEKEITDTSGNKVLQRIPLDVAKPNQAIIYKITVENEEKDTVSNVVLNIPVSKSLQVDPSSFIADIDMTVTFSATGQSFATFEDLSIPIKGGTRMAGPEDITAIRIDIPEIPKNETFYIEYDAVVR